MLSFASFEILISNYIYLIDTVRHINQKGFALPEFVMF